MRNCLGVFISASNFVVMDTRLPADLIVNAAAAADAAARAEYAAATGRTVPSHGGGGGRRGMGASTASPLKLFPRDRRGPCQGGSTGTSGSAWDAASRDLPNDVVAGGDAGNDPVRGYPFYERALNLGGRTWVESRDPRWKSSGDGR